VRHSAIARLARGTIPGLLATAVLYAGVHWGTTVAGGADPYGYLTEAGLLAQGRLTVQQPVILQSPWPGPNGTWAPIGYTERARQRDAIAPVYAPGLPLLMAILQALFGYCAAFWVVPICGAAAVWLTYALGRQLFGRPGIALWGALLVSTSPTFLFQLMNPMSDVPVTAAWALALVLALAEWPLAAGLAAAAAIAIRPNLVPLALSLVAWTALRDVRSRRTTGSFGTRAFRFALGLAPAVIGIAWLNARIYGSVLASGYGPLEDLYSWRYVWTNVSQFASWASQTDTPVVALAALFFVAPAAFPAARIAFPRALLGAFTASVILSYLFYLPFDAWWYLRFLLPMWPIVMLLTAAALEAIVRRWLSRVYRLAIAAAAVALASHGVITAANRGAFELWSAESRYIDVARFIGASTDPAAVFFSWQHTGSIRLYADRLTLHFGRLDRHWLDRAVDHLQAAGRHPYFVLDGHEIEPFRRRFAADNRLGALDWDPAAVFEEPYVAIYDPARRGTEGRLIVIPSSGGRSGRRCVRPPIWPPRLRIR